ncbi:hypothetical protein TNCV_3625651 [Trichonephila clavipes]|nr:hypothetical protein TNCV_3625651 [Trichonephila clavipes]
MPRRRWAIKKVGRKAANLPNDSENNRRKKARAPTNIVDLYLVFLWVMIRASSFASLEKCPEKIQGQTGSQITFT